MTVDNTKRTSINFDPLYQLLTESDHSHLSGKTIELYEKWSSQEVVIGFTGHFSAGKSSMINALLDQTILPSSPIPTSANIVQIRSGDEKVFYQLKDGTYTEDDEINEERIQQLSRNGEDVKSVQIIKPNDFIKDRVTIMDTPGIDSSDDMEFDRTLSQIHLIDLFVYVMDYNHVLSEVNFRFLRELERREVPYIVVVNQIDKHQEKELLFDSYKQQLRLGYQEWGLEPNDVYFTSLKDRTFDLNQFSALKEDLRTQMDILPEKLTEKINRELNLVIEVWKDEHTGNTGQADLLNRLELIEEQQSTIKENMDTIEQSLQKELNEILSNAYLMTYDTRELARLFLESQQQSFKVGGLFSKKKTEATKQERTEAFLKKLNERVQSEMVWAIRSHLKEVIQELPNDKDLLQRVQIFEFEASELLIKQEVNPAAQVTGDYVLLYTNGLQQVIKQSMLTDIQPLLRLIREEKSMDFKQQLEELEIEQKDIHQETNQETVAEVNQTIAALNERIHTKTEGQNHVIEMAYEKTLANHQKKSMEELLESTKQEDDTFELEPEYHLKEDSYKKLDFDQIQTNVQSVIEEAEQLPMIEPLVANLKKRFNQVQEKEYTVALFGAFSAGKSSFANILLGQQLLPVSPNPTTAAINKIRPVSQQREHGDVLIHFKSDETMQDQLQEILAPYTKKTFTSLQDITKYLKKEWQTLRAYFDQTEASFIEAFLKGIKQSKTSLSQTKNETLDTFSDYVTKEHLSCFVHEVEIFYESPLAKEGITLVDTPGADSIHARHTNVSLQYIKQADVILYVNYYNHAFSRADREFLKQLGRLSQTITAGKMFFILNASDLAETDDELLEVQHYLRSQLKQYGIEQSAVFPISSKELAKENPDETAIKQQQMLDRTFNEFMEREAKGIVFHNLVGELDRFHQLITETIETAKHRPEDQHIQLEREKELRDDLEKKLTDFDSMVYQNQFVQEVTELTHYLAERMDIQSIEWLKETINPATIQSNGKKGKEELEQAINQTVQLVKRKLDHEWYELDLLLDDQLNRIKNELIDAFNEDIEAHFPQEKIFFETEDYTGTTIPAGFDELTTSESKAFLKFFKNKKDFFEGNGRDLLFEEMTAWIRERKKGLIDQFSETFKTTYLELFDETKSTLINELLNNLDTQRENKRVIVENENVLEDLENLKTKIPTQDS